MSLDPRIVANYLRKIPLFEGMSVDEIADLVRTFRIETVKVDETVFAEGAPGEDMVIVESGSLLVTKRTAQGGQERFVALFSRPGETIQQLEQHPGPVAKVGGRRGLRHRGAARDGLRQAVVGQMSVQWFRRVTW